MSQHVLGRRQGGDAMDKLPEQILRTQQKLKLNMKIIHFQSPDPHQKEIHVSSWWCHTLSTIVCCLVMCVEVLEGIFHVVVYLQLCI